MLKLFTWEPHFQNHCPSGFCGLFVSGSFWEKARQLQDLSLDLRVWWGGWHRGKWLASCLHPSLLPTEAPELPLTEETLGWVDLWSPLHSISDKTCVCPCPKTVVTAASPGCFSVSCLDPLCPFPPSSHPNRLSLFRSLISGCPLSAASCSQQALGVGWMGLHNNPGRPLWARASPLNLMCLWFLDRLAAHRSKAHVKG